MKKIIIGSLLVVGLATGLAFAHGSGWGGGYGGHMMGYGGGSGGHMMNNGGHMMGYGGSGMMGPGMMGYGGYGNCPGAAAFGPDGWNSEKHQKFLEDTVDLRRELNDKRFEYMEVQRNPNDTSDKLASIEKEIIDIEKQLRDKAQSY